MNEPRYSLSDPLPPWDARRMPVLMAAICLVLYFLSGLSLGCGEYDAAMKAVIITACQAIGWRVLLLFGGPFRADAFYWVTTLGVGQLPLKVPPPSYPTVFTVSLPLCVVGAVVYATVFRRIGRWAARLSPPPYRPRGPGGTSGARRMTAAPRDDNGERGA